MYVKENSHRKKKKSYMCKDKADTPPAWRFIVKWYVCGGKGVQRGERAAWFYTNIRFAVLYAIDALIHCYARNAALYENTNIHGKTREKLGFNQSLIINTWIIYKPIPSLLRYQTVQQAQRNYLTFQKFFKPDFPKTGLTTGINSSKI